LCHDNKDDEVPTVEYAFVGGIIESSHYCELEEIYGSKKITKKGDY
tara:strand:- start:932 stop:1069 length:138 start_codon:yes stop_codon:yes gene_type:complete